MFVELPSFFFVSLVHGVVIMFSQHFSIDYSTYIFDFFRYV